MKFRSRIPAGLAGFLAVAALSRPALGQAPRTIAFQANVKTAAGQAVNGAVSVKFTIYDTGGTAQWSETQSLTAVNGLISARLGTVTALNLPFNAPYTVGVTVGSDPEMTPRVALASVPYALALPNVTVSTAGNVGIGVAAPGFPLNFSTALGDKISLWGVSGNNYGLGIQGSLLQIHTDTSGSDIAFGYGTSAAFGETARIKGNGNVGIGTSTPGQKLEVANGAIRVNFNSHPYDLNYQAATTSPSEPGYFFLDAYGAGRRIAVQDGTGNVGIGVLNPSERLQIGGRLAFQQAAGDQADAGKLDYRNFDQNSLSIVGAGTGGLNRNVRVFDTLSVGFSAPVGAAAAFNGSVGIGTSSPAARLDVQDTAYPSANVQSSSTSGAWLNVTNGSTGGTSWHLISTGSGNGEGAGKLIVASGAQAGVSSENMVFTSNGYVGIGTSTPQSALDVAGIARVHRVQIVGGSDVAEPYGVAASNGVKPAPGMVVCIDPERTGKMRVSTEAYDATVGGIISGANGVNPGMTLAQAGTDADGDLPIANVGRVWCFVDADAGGPVKPGDLLTTSSTPGHAMKAADRGRREGAILGKAMSRLDAGKGLVLVLVGLQ